MHNMLMAAPGGPGSTGAPGGYVASNGTGVHQHPESAFFKPKINTAAERGQMAPNNSSRAARLGSQRPPQGTLSPKGAPPSGPRGTDHLTNNGNGSPQHIWTSKKRTAGAPFSEGAQQAAQPRDDAAQQNQAQKKSSQAPPQPTDDIVFSDKHSLSDYIIGNKIGQGAYAVVHIGMHRKLNKKVALKIYEKEKIKDI